MKTRRRISEALRGEKHPFYGKHFSAETRKKMSEAKKGKKRSLETRRRMSEVHKGKTHSLETRRKISLTMRRRKQRDDSK